jgi:LacI family transcriptional regulator
MVDHPHGKTITQDDVARHAGVSRSIVSYVINNGPRKVSEATRNRVLAAIKELGYRPNKHAQMLSSTDDQTAEKYIGIILAGKHIFKRPYYGAILDSIHEHAHERDWHIRFIRVFDDFSNPALFNELIHPNEIRGVILLGLDQVLKTTDDKALIEEIIQRVDRVVCVDWEWPGVPSVHFDLHNAAYLATHHLLDSQRDRIAYIGPNDKRVSGYQQARWEKHLSHDVRLIYQGNDAKSGYESCEHLIRSGLPVDAICAGTDEVAIGVLNCLYRNGFRVPHDIAIASIDNIDISGFMIPSLTTIDVPKHEIGLHAIDILVSDDVWKGSSAFAITVSTHLIVRESTSNH